MEIRLPFLFFTKGKRERDRHKHTLSPLALGASTPAFLYTNMRCSQLQPLVQLTLRKRTEIQTVYPQTG
jgi:hypothetical protein